MARAIWLLLKQGGDFQTFGHAMVERRDLLLVTVSNAIAMRHFPVPPWFVVFLGSPEVILLVKA